MKKVSFLLMPNPLLVFRFVRQELKKHKEDANQRWNFDFEKEVPLKGRLEWEQVPREEIHPVQQIDR